MSCKYNTKIKTVDSGMLLGKRDSLTLKKQTKPNPYISTRSKTVRIIDSAQMKLPNISLVELFLLLSIPPPALFIKVTKINI